MGFFAGGIYYLRNLVADFTKVHSVDNLSRNVVTSVHVMLLVEKMHRATQAARTPCFFPKELRHTGVGACAASKRVSVVAISGDDVVIVTNGCNCAGYNCFLPNV